MQGRLFDRVSPHVKLVLVRCAESNKNIKNIESNWSEQFAPFERFELTEEGKKQSKALATGLYKYITRNHAKSAPELEPTEEWECFSFDDGRCEETMRKFVENWGCLHATTTSFDSFFDYVLSESHSLGDKTKVIIVCCCIDNYEFITSHFMILNPTTKVGTPVCGTSMFDIIKGDKARMVHSLNDLLPLTLGGYTNIDKVLLWTNTPKEMDAQVNF